MNPEWDKFFLGMAFYVSKKSKDPSTQVGAVIAKKKRFISLGYNGPPARVNDDPSMTREVKYRRTIHAEPNAIMAARRNLKNCTIYVTHHPCAQCAAKIIQMNMSRVVCPVPSGDFLTRWKDDFDEARLMFNEAGVIVDELNIIFD